MSAELCCEPCRDCSTNVKEIKKTDGSGPPPRFLKQVKADKNTNDRREINLKKTIHNDALIAAITTDVEANGQIYIRGFARVQRWHISRDSFSHSSSRSLAC
jgi:hypothetical protein